jgi:hypothetical protein
MIRAQITSRSLPLLCALLLILENQDLRGIAWKLYFGGFAMA